MNKFRSILYDSLLEITSRKIIYLYAALALIMVLIILLIPNLEIDGKSILEGEIISPDVMNQVFSRFIDAFLGFLIFLMVFARKSLDIKTGAGPSLLLRLKAKPRNFFPIYLTLIFYQNNI